MRLRATCIGALNLFANMANGLSDDDQALGQAMADVASIGILHERFSHEQHTLVEQLRTALYSRVTIEQAKGVISAHTDVNMDDAFQLLRHHARSNRQLLTDVASDIIHRRLTIDSPTPPSGLDITSMQ